ncbi:glycoside hydrolase [Brenneria izadpanahii]|uniref:Glycoside hydrolase n=1 Tax=Brenneria izadpanahii TaxID=2722756 RepID=A0ABX7UW75_9GAMM|nr:glycosyl hydrolase [Brenneria izadpanahii]QTF09998.1 glycoside hydrolase [Brenneria izadpanahii]
MMKKLHEINRGEEGNYLFPFLWLHGEDEATLTRHVDAIAQAGMRAFCVEARPHPDFLGERWWRDMDVVMDRARQKGMRVWLLDDAHFPTGGANGRVRRDFPHLQKTFLKIHQNDFHGPRSHTHFLLDWARAIPRPGILSAHDNPYLQPDYPNRIVGVVAARLLDYERVDPASLTDLSDRMRNGVLYWDLPEGDWRLFTLVETQQGGEKATEGYLDPLRAEATQVLIDTVYEPHFQRYQQDFGRTFAGFFSDEPRFGNTSGAGAIVGQQEMVLPWNDEVLDLLRQPLGAEALKLLPLLAVEGGEIAHRVRYHYMDIVSGLYSARFSGQLAAWCRRHQVQYIGHIIEDNNAHARLGYGAGHFFRALRNQDMAGIDVVLNQIVPGMDKGYFKAFTSQGWDGEFFHYALAKLGSSLAHVTPGMKGRAFCEIFGANGWAEGLSLMRWLTDHMLVRGINAFVPHAFSAAPFPDADCPPHIYADGHDPLYRFWPYFTRYVNRAAHLLSGGRSAARVALLYHAEAEWSGRAMLLQQPARELMQRQIDFDILSLDDVLAGETARGGLRVNQSTYQTLVIPWSEALPAAGIERLLTLARHQVNLRFIRELPERYSDQPLDKGLAQLANEPAVCAVELTGLADHLVGLGMAEARCDEAQPWLRYYHYCQDDGDIFMWFNEHPGATLTTEIALTRPEPQALYFYEPQDNAFSAVDVRWQQGSAVFTLSLEPGESRFMVTGRKFEPVQKTPPMRASRSLDGPCMVSLSRTEDYPRFSAEFPLEKRLDLAAPERFPDFVGTVRYEYRLQLEKETELAWLHLSQGVEAVEVFVNGSAAGVRIAPPYRFPLGNKLVAGENRIVLEITNTLVKSQKDYLSHFLPQDPTGIVGDIRIELY